MFLRRDLREEGLFRVAPAQSQLDSLLEALQMYSVSNTAVDFEQHSLHELASAIKWFYRNLASPLLGSCYSEIPAVYIHKDLAVHSISKSLLLIP